MSFGAPGSSPYGPPEDKPAQPGYGYPPAAPAYGGGYPGVPWAMPGGVKAARVMLLVIGGLQAVAGVVMVVASSWFADLITDNARTSGARSEDVDTVASIGAGIMIVMGVLVLAFAVWGLITGMKLAKGGNGIRISGIVYASIVTFFSAVSLLGANLFALISVVLGILIIVFLAKAESAAWFRRPRH
ncbi:hypothetical protein [Streptomyces sp. NPDC046887]|uniref:hypothetical protein n=1 Tax=Streptomyces sp. NPDC046887 TaxID=3155472 RepID=UPI0033DF126D